MKLIIQLFLQLFSKFPLHFISLVLGVFFQAVTNTLAVISIAPITDFLLERTGENASSITAYFESIVSNYGLDFSSNDLGTFLNKNTNFIHEKYKWIYYFYFEDDITNQVKSYIEKIKKDLSIVQKKEPYNVRAQDHTRRMEEEFLELNNNKKKFLSIFNSNPNYKNLCKNIID